MNMLFRGLIGAVVVALLWAGGLYVVSHYGESLQDWDARYQFDLPPAEAMAAIEALGSTPHPLDRMGIAAPRQQVERNGKASVDVVIPAVENGDGVHFAFKFSEFDSGTKTLVGLIISTGDLPELDLGTDRLISRSTLAKRADEALDSYAREKNGRGAGESAKAQFGRLFDQAALLGDPTARAQVLKSGGNDERLGPLFGTKS